MRTLRTAGYALALAVLGAVLAAPSQAVPAGPVAVPEPSSYALLGLGLVPLALVARKRLLSRKSD